MGNQMEGSVRGLFSALFYMSLGGLVCVGGVLLGGRALDQKNDLHVKLAFLRSQVSDGPKFIAEADWSDLQQFEPLHKNAHQRIDALFVTAKTHAIGLGSLSVAAWSGQSTGCENLPIEWSIQGPYIALRRLQANLQNNDPLLAMSDLQLRSLMRDGSSDGVEARMSWVMYEAY